MSSARYVGNLLASYCKCAYGGKITAAIQSLDESSTMDLQFHRIGDLFDQLGLPSGPARVHAFIARHTPLPDSTLLVDAHFWTPAQSSFLGEKLQADDDWSMVIDVLDVRLRTCADPTSTLGGV